MNEEELLNEVDKRGWTYVCMVRDLPESFMSKYYHSLWWTNIIQYQILSQGFIEQHCDEIDWDLVSKLQILSEPFIKKYEGKVNWVHISRYQKLSRRFIVKYSDLICWNNLLKNKQIGIVTIYKCIVSDDIREWFDWEWDFRLSAKSASIIRGIKNLIEKIYVLLNIDIL